MLHVLVDASLREVGNLQLPQFSLNHIRSVSDSIDAAQTPLFAIVHEVIDDFSKIKGIFLKAAESPLGNLTHVLLTKLDRICLFRRFGALAVDLASMRELNPLNLPPFVDPFRHPFSPRYNDHFLSRKTSVVWGTTLP